jgi:hypothetical protein
MKPIATIVAALVAMALASGASAQTSVPSKNFGATVRQPSSGASAQTSVPSKATPPLVAPATPTAQTALTKVFDPDMLGATVGYFEKVTGPAWKIHGKTRTYKVNDCVVETTTNEGDIKSLRVVLNKNCTFDMNKFFMNYTFPNPQKMTFGMFDKSIRYDKNSNFSDTKFSSPCLVFCGNAETPVVYEHWGAPHSDQFIEVLLEVDLLSDSAIKASYVWQNAMSKIEGEKWMSEAMFNCTKKYDIIAHNAFKDIKISAITIGYNIQPNSCE